MRSIDQKEVGKSRPDDTTRMETTPQILFSQTYNAGMIGLLSSMKQVHDAYIIGAINEFQDNAIEAHAANQWVRLDADSNFGYIFILSFLDDGCGLDKRSWSRLLALGDRKGDNNYGVGCKSGSFSIGKTVLVFSKSLDNGKVLWGVAFFSKGCSHGQQCLQCGRWKTNFVPPVVYWREDGSAITSENHNRGGGGGGGRRNTMELSTEGVENELKEIFKDSLIKSIKGIEDQFKKIRSETGTLILISDLVGKSDQDVEGRVLEVDSVQNANPDIQVYSHGDSTFMRSRVGFTPGRDIPVDYSLRAQSELLLRPVDGGGRSMIKFHIQGIEVNPQKVETMCQYGGMKNFDFSLDLQKKETSFDQGIHKVRCKLGFSPAAFDKEIGGLFFYYDKGNGDPLRLVQSYQLKEGVHVEFYDGMVGVVIVEALSELQKMEHAQNGITMHNGKQKFNPSNVLTAMQGKCFELMLDYLEDFEFKSHKEAYKKSEASSQWHGLTVWVKPGIWPGQIWSKKLGWWPGKIMNRYDREIVRPVPAEVLSDGGSEDKDALLIHLFGAEKNSYYWCKHEEIKTHLVNLLSDEGRRIEQELKKYSGSEMKRLQRAIVEANEHLSNTHEDAYTDTVQCFRCAAWRKTEYYTKDIEGTRAWQCSRGYFEGEDVLRVCRTAAASQSVAPAASVAEGLEEVEISALITSPHVKLIGSGVHGTVHKVRWEGEDWAAKIYHTGTNTQAFLREIRALKRLQTTVHPNIVTLRAVESQRPAILMEFCDMNMLQAVETKTFSLATLLTFALHISLGMKRMHSLQLAHGDLKLENILLRKRDSDSVYIAKISDYGLAKLPGSSSAGAISDTYLKAPEFWLEDGAAEFLGADIFAVGWIYLEMLAGKKTSWREKEGNQLKKLYCGNGEIGDFELLNSKILDSEAKSLIETCWARDPAKRLKFEQQEKILQAIISRTDSLQGGDLRDFQNIHSTTMLYRVLDDDDVQNLCDGKGILSRAAHNRVQGDAVPNFSRDELETHIRTGRNGANESRCISTSRSKEWCMWYVHKKNHLRSTDKLKRSTDHAWYPVAQIDLSKINDVRLIDVSTETLCEEKLKLPMNRYFAQDAKEVILLSDIPVSAITNWYELNPTGHFGRRISQVVPDRVKEYKITKAPAYCDKARTPNSFECFFIWKEGFGLSSLNLKIEELLEECNMWANEIRSISGKESKAYVPEQIKKTALFKIFKSSKNVGASSSGKSSAQNVPRTEGATAASKWKGVSKSGGGEEGESRSKDGPKTPKKIEAAKKIQVTQISEGQGKAVVDNDGVIELISSDDDNASATSGVIAHAVTAATAGASRSEDASTEEEGSFSAVATSSSANLPLKSVSKAETKTSKTPERNKEKRKRNEGRDPSDVGATNGRRKASVVNDIASLQLLAQPPPSATPAQPPSSATPLPLSLIRGLSLPLPAKTLAEEIDATKNPKLMESATTTVNVGSLIASKGDKVKPVKKVMAGEHPSSEDTTAAEIAVEAAFVTPAAARVATAATNAPTAAVRAPVPVHNAAHTGSSASSTGQSQYKALSLATSEEREVEGISRDSNSNLSAPKKAKLAQTIQTNGQDRKKQKTSAGVLGSGDNLVISKPDVGSKNGEGKSAVSKVKSTGSSSRSASSSVADAKGARRGGISLNPGGVSTLGTSSDTEKPTVAGVVKSGSFAEKLAADQALHVPGVASAAAAGPSPVAVLHTLPLASTDSTKKKEGKLSIPKKEKCKDCQTCSCSIIKCKQCLNSFCDTVSKNTPH